MLSLPVSASNAYFAGSCDGDALGYKIGEKMKFSLRILDDRGNAVKGQKFKWVRRGDDGITESGTAVSGKEPVVIETSIGVAGFVRITATPVDNSGKRAKNCDAFDGGACAGFGEIRQTTPEPRDFDGFWRRQLSYLDKVPPKCKKEPVFLVPGFKTYILTIDCVGKPAKAYLTIPEGAMEKSLPLSVFFRGYGIGRIYPKFDRSCISLSVARHSYDLGRDDDYYKSQSVLLKNFGMKASENKNPENSYFRNMLLRDHRAIEVAKKLPEWDGKNIKVSGGSMGAFRSIFAAMLDKDITLCDVFIPWLSNLNGEAEGKMKSICMPEYVPELLYYDISNAIKRVECPVKISARLGDYECPPSGIAILYHNTKGRVELNFSQNGTHGYTSPWKDNPTYSRSK